MKTEKQLKIKLGNLQTEIDGITLLKKQEKRDFSDDERSSLERLMSEQDLIVSDIKKIVTDKRSGLGLDHFDFGAGTEIDLGGSKEFAELPKAGWRGYRNHFPMTGENRFKSFREFVGAVMSGGDSRLTWVSDQGETRATGMGEAIPTEGGFQVPEEYAATMFDIALESTVMFKHALTVPMSAPTKKIPAYKIGDHGTNLFGGIIFYWKDEGKALQGVKPALRQVTLTADKLTGLTYASNELRMDAPDFEERLSGMLGLAGGWYLDDSLINGDGAGKPLGLLNSPCKIAVSAETGQDAGSVVAENINSMVSRLHPACIPNARYLANPTTYPFLRTLNFPIGTAGALSAMFQRTAGGFTLDGIPLFFTEKCPAVGTEGDIILVDPTQYAVGLRGDMQLAVSGHVAFLTDESVWRVIFRVCGTSLWDTALTPKNGETLSPIITIETR